MACLAMALCCLVSACSDDEGETAVELSFTQPEALNVARLDSCDSVVSSFELTSNVAWNLYSDRMWVKLSLSPDGGYFNDIQGGAGSYTVYIKVTNDARDFKDSQAMVNVVAGENSQNVVTVVRKAKQRFFTLLSSDGEKLERVEMNRNTSVWVVPDANFECSILSSPEWLEEPEALSGGYTLNVSADYIPYEASGVLVFGNIDGTALYELPVSYAGMNPAVIRIEGENTPWGWKVSLDGKTFVQETTTSADEATEKVVEEALDYSVTCFNYDFRLVGAELNSGKLSLMDEENPWIKAMQDEKNPSRVSVSVSPFNATAAARSRDGYLFAVPAALYSDFVSSLAASSDADTFVDEHQSFVLVELQQKDLEGSNGFIITDGSGAAVPCVKEEEHYEWLCSEFSITDVTTCNVVPGESYTIDTRLTADEWKKNYALTDLEGNQQRVSRWNFKAELGSDGMYKITITVPATLDKPILLRLYTPQIVNIKALLMRPVAKDN